eukprot:11965_1
MNGFCAGVVDVPVKLLYTVGGLNADYSFFSSSMNNSLEWTYYNSYQPFNATAIYFYGQSCVIHNNILYGVPDWTYNGGTNNGNKLFIFNLTDHKYLNNATYKNKLIQTSDTSCVQLSNDIIFVIGGKILNSFANLIRLATVQTYDIINNKWTSKASLSFARSNAGCSVNTQNINSAEYIYVFGGLNGDKISYTFLQSIEKYNIQNDEWTVLDSTFNVGRANHQCLFVRRYIWCVGGYTEQVYGEPYNPLNVEIFEPITDSIIDTVEVKLNVGRNDFAMYRTHENDLLVLGGHSYQKGILKSVEQSTETSSPTSTPTFAPTDYTQSPTTHAPTNLPTTMSPTSSIVVTSKVSSQNMDIASKLTYKTYIFVAGSLFGVILIISIICYIHSKCTR